MWLNNTLDGREKWIKSTRTCTGFNLEIIQIFGYLKSWVGYTRVQTLLWVEEVSLSFVTESSPAHRVLYMLHRLMMVVPCIFEGVSVISIGSRVIVVCCVNGVNSQFSSVPV